MTNTTLDSLPHREPFRFVSGIEELEPGRRAVGLWCVSGEEGFFAGHFPGNPVLPGVLLAEALAQLSGMVAFAEGRGDGAASDRDRPAPRPATPARLAQVSVKFHSGVVPPAEIRLESTLTRAMSGLHLFDVRAEVHGVVVASGSLVLARAL